MNKNILKLSDETVIFIVRLGNFAPVAFFWNIVNPDKIYSYGSSFKDFIFSEDGLQIINSRKETTSIEPTAFISSEYDTSGRIFADGKNVFDKILEEMQKIGNTKGYEGKIVFLYKENKIVVFKENNRLYFIHNEEPPVLTPEGLKFEMSFNDFRYISK